MAAIVLTPLNPVRGVLIETALPLVYTISVGRRYDVHSAPHTASCRRQRANFARAATHIKGLEMAENLRVSVRRQVDRLRKDLAAATARVAELREEIRRHENWSPRCSMAGRPVNALSEIVPPAEH